MVCSVWFWLVWFVLVWLDDLISVVGSVWFGIVIVWVGGLISVIGFVLFGFVWFGCVWFGWFILVKIVFFCFFLPIRLPPYISFPALPLGLPLQWRRVPDLHER